MNTAEQLKNITTKLNDIERRLFMDNGETSLQSKVNKNQFTLKLLLIGLGFIAVLVIPGEIKAMIFWLSSL